MEVDVTRIQEDDGKSLNLMLTAYRTFMESAYSMFRRLDGEFSKRGWEIVKPNGYGITRNGYGGGLAKFDWLMDYVGIAFVPKGSTTSKGVDIPQGGLRILIFQVRTLDKAPDQPVVWRIELLVELSPETQSFPWEKFQRPVLDQLKSSSNGNITTDLDPGIAKVKIDRKEGSITYSGHYKEVPVASLLGYQDVIRELVDAPLFSQMSLDVHTHTG